MIKFQNANVDKDSCPHHIIEYTYIGLKAELVAFNATKKASENEFWFCPDTQETYYWNKDAQQFLKLGTGYTPTPPPEPAKLDTPSIHQGSMFTVIEWESVKNADYYTVETYDDSALTHLRDTRDVVSAKFDTALIDRLLNDMGANNPVYTVVIAKSNSEDYEPSDRSNSFKWEYQEG